MDNISTPPHATSWLALLDPLAHGFPSDPRLRLPVLAWIKRDPSPEAQAMAQAIWGTFPRAFQAEAMEVMGWEGLEKSGV